MFGMSCLDDNNTFTRGVNFGRSIQTGYADIERKMKNIIRPFSAPVTSALLLSLLVAACTYTQKVRDGRTAYEVKQYAVATELLRKEYRKAKSRVEKGKIAYLLGKSYEEINESEKSIDWFMTAYNNAYGVDALRDYAYALKKAERYQEAIDAFRNLGIEIGSPYEYRREINACEVAMGWRESDRRQYRVELLPFNSKFADYSPTVYKGNQLVITSDRAASTGKDTYNWTGNAFSDLFLVDLNSNNIAGFDQALNSPHNEGTIAFSQSYDEVYFTRCFGGKKEDAYCKLMESKNRGNSWTAPRVLDFVEDGVNYGHPSLSADGQELYFSCNHPDGWGGYDIYLSRKTPEGWGQPKLLGRSVNTPGDEKFPFIDGDTLYFSSNRHTGMGGLDVFRVYRLNNGSWSPPYNLLPPINSGGDDFGFVIDYQAPVSGEVLQSGYFSSTRNDGFGSDDIYRFEKIVLPPEPEPEVVAEEEPEYQLLLNGYVLEKIYEDPGNPNSKVLGRRPLPDARVTVQKGSETKTFTVAEDGLFTMELDENADYEFLAAKPDYLNNDARFSTKGIGKDPNRPVQTFEIEIVLDRIFVNQEIVLENIYYDFDRWEIRDDAEPTLNELTANLKLNPDIRIQLGSHTDCRGNNRYNEVLSQRRAQSAVDYLIAQGIDPVRLEAKGYGEEQPAVDCICARCTEEEHQSNRRTTFKIIQ